MWKRFALADQIHFAQREIHISCRRWCESHFLSLPVSPCFAESELSGTEELAAERFAVGFGVERGGVEQKPASQALALE